MLQNGGNTQVLKTTATITLCRWRKYLQCSRYYFLPVGGNIDMPTFAVFSKSNNNAAPGKKEMLLTQGEDQSPHNHPGKVQGTCFLESYWP